MDVAVVIGLAVAALAVVGGLAWVVTREREDQASNFDGFAARHPGFAVDQRSDPGLFAHRYPVLSGTHRGRVVEVRTATDGWRTARPASHTHTSFTVHPVRGLPADARVFPSMGGGLTTKGGARGAAEGWLTASRRAALERRLATGYVSISDRLGLRIHVEGTVLDDAQLTAGLDGVTHLADTLEAG